MCKPKFRYLVYRVDTSTYSNGRENVSEYFLGSTYAKSERQAINQVKYRLGIKPSDLYCIHTFGGERVTTFKAILG